MVTFPLLRLFNPSHPLGREPFLPLFDKLMESGKNLGDPRKEMSKCRQKWERLVGETEITSDVCAHSRVQLAKDGQEGLKFLGRSEQIRDGRLDAPPCWDPPCEEKRLPRPVLPAARPHKTPSQPCSTPWKCPKPRGTGRIKLTKDPMNKYNFLKNHHLQKSFCHSACWRIHYFCAIVLHPSRPPHRKKAALPSLTYHKIVILLTPHLITVSRPISLRFGCSLQKYQATFHLWVGGKKYRRSRRRNRRQPKGSAGYFKKVWWWF